MPSESANPSSSASASDVAVTLPHVSAAPAGTWKSIEWMALPTASALHMSPDTDSPSQVFGWSRGYVAFSIHQRTQEEYDAGTAMTVTSSYSPDGVHWQDGQRLDMKYLSATMPLMGFQSVLEGPGSLLAVGFAGACGSLFVNSLWTSTDGIAWQPVDLAVAFNVSPSAIVRVSGGAAGYVAVAYRGEGVWTSKDGRDWQSVQLGGGAFEDARVDAGTATSGSFVLGGATGTSDCGGPGKSVLRTPSVWWSADGSSWNRAALPGATATSDFQEMSIANLNTHAVLAVNTVVSGGTERKASAWGSNDGRTWTPVGLPDDVRAEDIISAGQYNLIVRHEGDWNTPGKLQLRTIDASFSVLPIAQIGDIPEITPGWGGGGQIALGPTGIVLVWGDQVWFGTPSAA